MKPSQAQPLPALMLSALGVVFGDIGTSPLYAFKEAFSPDGGLAPSSATVFPVLSMMFWAVTIVVSLKYVLIMLRFDHRGEGGVLALLARALTSVGERPRLAWIVAALGVFAAPLFYGDAIITPAISVLSAVAGITLAAPQLHPLVVPLAISILCVLFILQRRGTARVGSLFGPVMLIWFVSLAALGINSIIESPDVLSAVDPRHALAFAINQPATMFMVLGAVFLTVTGAEAMFADLGHFGARPIRIGWFALVFPCLMLNYFGQAALVLREPEAVRNPFFLLAPDALLLPLVALATLATVIASQATISGAFSVTQQASRLNYLPRLKVSYTSETSQGQIYIPVVNWLLLAAVVLLVTGFRSSSNLAAAYGLAVSGDLAIGSVLLGMLILLDPRRRLRLLLIPMAFFFALEIGFLIANASKFIEGGWFPLAVALIMFTLLTTWKRGTEIIRARKDAMPRVRTDLSDMNLEGIARVPGSAVFFSAGRQGCPTSFLHKLRHNKVMHQQVVFLTVEFTDTPRVADSERMDIERLLDGVTRVVARFGYRENADISRVLKLARRKGLDLDLEQTSFFTSKPAVVSVSRRGLWGWRRSLFGWLLQNSPTTAHYFSLPPNRVVELGTQVAI